MDDRPVTVCHRVVFAAPRKVEVQKEILAGPEAGQVVVKTLVSAISPGTEMLFYRGQAPAGISVDATIAALGADDVAYPLHYGYACVGEVVGVGANVDPAWRGALVFAFHPHASYFCAPLSEVQRVPEQLAPERAVLLPTMETAVNFVMDGRPTIGERVAVVGQGIVGLITTALLAKFPLSSLTAVDPLPRRRAMAIQMGASTTLTPEDVSADPAADTDRADLAYEISGSPAALNTAIALTGFAGRIVIGSWYGQKQAPIDLGGAFHRSRIRLISSQVSTIDPTWSGRWDKARRLGVAWAMLAQVDTTGLITQRFPMTQAAAAYRLIDAHPDETIQVLLEYDMCCVLRILPVNVDSEHATRNTQQNGVKPMYTLAVKRDFVAQHYLIGGDWGAENFWHSHHYQLELLLEGDMLDQHGYLVDIVDVEQNLQTVVEHYRDKTLNDLPEFTELNPSIEHFTRIICLTLAARLNAATLRTLTVKIWENEIAWASYRHLIQ